MRGGDEAGVFAVCSALLAFPPSFTASLQAWHSTAHMLKWNLVALAGHGLGHGASMVLAGPLWVIFGTNGGN